MAKKQFFLIVDTETTIESTVADFGAVIVDRKGVIHAECSVLVKGEFDAKELFYDANSKDAIWTLEGLKRRRENYVRMLNEGSRMLASVAAINRWLEKANAKYAPVLTAYNLAFDLDKCQNTGIDLAIFADRFCLWHMAVGHFAGTKPYKAFVMQNKFFTEKLNIKTNAEVMASFVAGEVLPPEPHTALEDAKFYEAPILNAIVNKKDWRAKCKGYNWRDWQMKDHFIPV
jgi:hypothetical protein